MGFLDRDRVRQVLSRSLAGLVLLHPIINYLDALPVKMFEYMCAGIPVIASDFPLWREIIQGNNCGLLVDPLEPTAIAKAIDYLVENPREAQRMGENGRKAVEARYNWESEEKKLLRFYDKILGIVQKN
jgi:glycosyltransferase involved in cell wall biosynthesis